jgi:uncharacterized protein YjbI with pentapeptide repeats
MNDTLPLAAPRGLAEAPASFAPKADDASDLRAEELRGRDLRGRDLTKVEGLLPEHVAGADLTWAKLPEEIAKFPALEQVRAISAEARKVFIGLLAACVYSWLVSGKTHDVDLILNTAGSPLPIINTAIPTAGFYVVGAAILAAVYCYLHFYLQRLWRTLATLPAIFPDGVALDDKSDPWLLTSLVRTEFTVLRPIAPPLTRLENLLAVFLTWWLVPITLLGLWARYLPAHAWLGTSWLILLIGLAALFGRHTYRLARAALQGQTSSTAEPTDADGGILARACRGLRLDKLTGCLTVGLLVCSISAFRDDPQDPYTWVAKGLNALGFIGIRTYADLREVAVAQKPEGWDGKDWSKVKRVDLRSRNLAFADVNSAFLANADLRDADLAGANLREAQLQGAILHDAQLRGARLDCAQLQGADLFGAQLQGARLRCAQLQGADLSGAHLQGAHLSGAQLQGANLGSAQLQGAELFEAQLQGANLGSAHLQGADLNGAQLQGANLGSAHLQGADLNGAQLQGADLRGAALWRALVFLASDDDWNFADLRDSTVEPLDKTKVDGTIAQVSAELADETVRSHVVEELTKALETDDRPPRPKFPDVWQSEPNVMFSASDPKPEPLRWGRPTWATEQGYDKALAKFLGDLACSRDASEAQTRGLASLAVYSYMNKPERLWPKLFAARAAGPDGPGLPEDTRRELQDVSSTPEGELKQPLAVQLQRAIIPDPNNLGNVDLNALSKLRDCMKRSEAPSNNANDLLMNPNFAKFQEPVAKCMGLS